ncbi:hypothetical protein DFH08DRAFT_815861 [Mycena albidolilacea]|uniref:Uncharacterized protein n=1 Tax=Mycena albidolilacea TaxID=1033008 RepID=A0AAD7EJZ6_9AGAR|nr:hypothetical protein DFH08DRAFT_815861 [Mycena albidolilacea]
MTSQNSVYSMLNTDAQPSCTVGPVGTELLKFTGRWRFDSSDMIGGLDHKASISLAINIPHNLPLLANLFKMGYWEDAGTLPASRVADGSRLAAIDSDFGQQDEGVPGVRVYYQQQNNSIQELYYDGAWHTGKSFDKGTALTAIKHERIACTSSTAEDLLWTPKVNVNTVLTCHMSLGTRAVRRTGIRPYADGYYTAAFPAVTRTVLGRHKGSYGTLTTVRDLPYGAMGRGRCDDAISDN